MLPADQWWNRRTFYKPVAHSNIYERMCKFVVSSTVTVKGKEDQTTGALWCWHCHHVSNPVWRSLGLPSTACVHDRVSAVDNDYTHDMEPARSTVDREKVWDIAYGSNAGSDEAIVVRLHLF